MSYRDMTEPSLYLLFHMRIFDDEVSRPLVYGHVVPPGLFVELFGDQRLNWLERGAR
jgi:hypothetical protein